MVPERVAAAVSEIEGSTGRAIGHVVDIADEDAVAGLFAEIGEPIWGLVNNAAMADAVGGASFWEIDRSTWDQLLAVNLTGTWLVSKHAAPATDRTGCWPDHQPGIGRGAVWEPSTLALHRFQGSGYFVDASDGPRAGSAWHHRERCRTWHRRR